MLNETAKADLRRMLRQRRRVAAGRLNRHFGADAVKVFLSVPELASLDRCVVAGYWPVGFEADVVPLMRHLHDQGHTTVLPVVVAKGKPLDFRAWSPGDVLENGPLRTLEPRLDKEPHTPDLVLVPLLGVDEMGYRLGQGGGFYDRTLHRLRSAGPIVAVGIAFDEQAVEHVPREATDEPLDWLITEHGVRQFKREQP